MTLFSFPQPRIPNQAVYIHIYTIGDKNVNIDHILDQGS